MMLGELGFYIMWIGTWLIVTSPFWWYAYQTDKKTKQQSVKKERIENTSRSRVGFRINLLPKFCDMCGGFAYPDSGKIFISHNEKVNSQKFICETCGSVEVIVEGINK